MKYSINRTGNETGFPRPCCEYKAVGKLSVMTGHSLSIGILQTTFKVSTCAFVSRCKTQRERKTQFRHALRAGTGTDSLSVVVRKTQSKTCVFLERNYLVNYIILSNRNSLKMHPFSLLFSLFNKYSYSVINSVLFESQFCLLSFQLVPNSQVKKMESKFNLIPDICEIILKKYINVVESTMIK